MRYPKFLKEGSTIGITAPSSGVGKDLEGFEKSLNHLKEQQWNIIETKNVRTTGDVSSSPEERAKELKSLVLNEKVDAIICAKGGDFLTDMLPFIETKSIQTHEKWYMGASDPTNLLYTITTGLDIATMYGHNAGAFDSTHLFESQINAIEYLKGNLIVQESYPFYESNREERVDGDYALTEKSVWKSLNGDIDVTGRIIGGCLDCLRYLPGTKYDKTKKFIDKYKKDGFIWFFDIFNMSAEDVYLTLFQLKEAGWFENVKGIIVGRVLYPKNYTQMTYEKAFQETFGELPIITEADVGHIVPKMTIINGSIAHITYKDKKGTIEQFLK